MWNLVGSQLPLNEVSADRPVIIDLDATLVTEYFTRLVVTFSPSRIPQAYLGCAWKESGGSSDIEAKPVTHRGDQRSA